MICELKYFDENGNLSADYYSNLHLGHDKALEIYLNKNKGIALTKFQKLRTQEELEEESEKIKLTSDGQSYEKVTANGDVFTTSRATSLTKDYMKPFDDEAAAKKMAIYQLAVQISKDEKTDLFELGYSKENNPRKENYRINIDKDPKLFKLAEKLAEEKPVEFENLVSNIKDKFKYQAEAGDRSHAVIETFFKYFRDLKKDENGDYNWGSIVTDTIKAIDDQEILEQSQELLNGLLKFVKKKFPNPEKLIVLPEFAMTSERMGISGRADLVIINDKNEAYIYDTKTKEEGKSKNFTAEFERMSGPLSNLYQNKFEQVSIQTSIYQMMLEELGYKVKERAVLYVEGDFNKITGEGWKYQNIKLSKVINLESRKKEINAVLREKGIEEEASKKVYQTGKINNANEALQELTGESLDRVLKGQALENKINNILDANRIDENNGRAYFFNKLEKGKRTYYKSSNREKRKEELRDYFKKLEKYNDDLANKFVRYANNQDTIEFKGSNKEKTQAKNLVKGLSSEEYNFTKLREITGFEDYNPNIILALHKHTREAHIININADNEYLQPEIESSYNKRNIFRKYINDITFKKIAGGDAESLTYSSANLQLLRAGIIGLELLKSKYIDSIGTFSTGVIKGDDSTPTKTSAKVIFPHLKVMKNILASKNLLSSDFEKVLNDKLLNKPEETKTDILTYVEELFNEGYTFNAQKGYIEKLQQSILDFRVDPLTKRAPLLDALINTYNNLHEVLHAKYGGSEEKIREDKEYRILSELILQLSGVHFMAGVESKSINELTNKFRIHSSVKSEAVKFLDRETQKRDRVINQIMADFNAKKKKVMSDLMAYYNSDSVLTKVTDNDITGVFSNLWKVAPGEYDKNNPDKLYFLKDESEVDSKEEKAFISFFNESMLKAFSLTMEEADYKAAAEGKTWPKGMIPAIPASVINQITQAETVKEKAKLSLKSLLKRTRESVGDKNLPDIHEIIKTDVANQVGTGEMQNTTARRELLGIDAEGNQTDTGSVLETNLERILLSVMSKSVSAYQHNKTMAVYNALSTMLYLDQNENFNATADTRKFMQEAIKLKIKNEQYQEGPWADGLDKTKKLASTLAFGASTKQFLLEGTTNTYAVTSSVLSQAMLGKNKRFNPGEFTKASAFVVANPRLVAKLNEKLGLYNGDPTNWTKRDKLETSKYGWFQSKVLHYLNSVPFKFFKTDVIYAELIHKGILKAISLDNNGNIKYEPHKDERFKAIFNSKGEVRKNLTSKEDLKVLARYEKFLEDAAADGTLDEKGNPTSPVSLNELGDMQNYALSIFGSIDNDAKVNGTLTAWSRMFMTFRSWYIAKKENYWTRTSKSKTRGKDVWVEDADMPNGGYWKFEYDDVEGILQTFNYILKSGGIMLKQMSAEGMSWNNMNDRQKENLIKFTTDAALMSILTLVIGMAMDDEDDIFGSGYGKKIGQIALAGVGDLNMFTTSQDMIKANPLAALSYTLGVLGRVKDVIVYSATGEGEKAANSALKLTGATKLFADD
jgi:hypothetical protein